MAGGQGLLQGEASWGAAQAIASGTVFGDGRIDDLAIGAGRTAAALEYSDCATDFCCLAPRSGSAGLDLQLDVIKL